MKEIITIDMIIKEMRTPSNWNDAATMALEFVWDQTEEWFETFTVNMESMREDLDLFIEARFDGDDKIMYAGDAANWSIIALDAIISEITSEAPKPFTKRRKGRSVTPDIGARRTLLSSWIGPIFIIISYGAPGMTRTCAHGLGNHCSIP